MGIVKKNAIMMIDFAREAEREQGLSPREAIDQACALRFRPIMMTTLAALLGALPLALAHGSGAELRRAARHLDRRRPAAEPVPHPLHDAGDLPPARIGSVRGSACATRRCVPPVADDGPRAGPTALPLSKAA